MRLPKRLLRCSTWTTGMRPPGRCARHRTGCGAVGPRAGEGWEPGHRLTRRRHARAGRVGMRAELMGAEAIVATLPWRRPRRNTAPPEVPGLLCLARRALLSQTEEGRAEGDPVAGPLGADRRPEVDDVVVQRARRGDHDAFHTIVDHYEERLRLLAFHMLRDAEQMNDAVQDTFVKAYAALPGFRAEAALGTWMHAIC
ncbi:MAG: hypothetical protein EHM52_05825, partial [Actinomycetota bacterium]